jgi:glycine cleavage system aminomethyltransferase T
VTSPLRRAPASRLHAEAGASFATEAGWEIPTTYGDEAAERASAGEAVTLVDVTARGKVDVRGEPDEMLASTGDALIARVDAGWVLVLTPPGEEEILVPKLAAAVGPTTMVTDATHLFAGLAFVGPRLEEALSLLTSWDPSTLGPGEATGAPLAEVRAILMRRDLGVPVLEAYVASEFARYAWESCLDAVRRAGGGPAGWTTLRSLGWS